MIVISYFRFAYAPYGALKKMGVNGPVPRAFWGNVSSFVKVSHATDSKGQHRLHSIRHVGKLKDT